jgi:hypothetical protein
MGAQVTGTALIPNQAVVNVWREQLVLGKGLQEEY